MLKTFTVAAFAMVVGFFATSTVVHGQTATTTPTVTTAPTTTPAPTSTQSAKGTTTVPQGAPSTGHGGY